MFDFLKRWFSPRPAPAPEVDADPAPLEATPVPDGDGVESLADEVRELVDASLKSGFATVDEAITTAVEVLSEEGTDENEIRALATTAAASAYDRLLAEAAAWSHPTDNERLDEAFTRLESAGIVTRQNWTCCQTCGNAEILDEVERLSGEGRPVRGYAYFHQQDTESAVEGGGVMLAYGPASDDRSAKDVGVEVVRVLREAGLDPQWNGDVGKRIHVPMEWRRLPRQPEPSEFDA